MALVAPQAAGKPEQAVAATANAAADLKITVQPSPRAVAAAATPLGFSGSPEDIAEGVIYLCSDAARFVTGSELVIDGGVFAG